jgi:hypothetical protein
MWPAWDVESNMTTNLGRKANINIALTSVLVSALVSTVSQSGSAACSLLGLGSVNDCEFHIQRTSH